MSKKLFFKGVYYSYLRQVITLLTGIISLPLLLNYFGIDSYGIWVLIWGLAGYINTISFGIPSAMITLVSKTSDLNEKYLILNKSFYILSILSTFFLALFVFVLYLSDDWIISLLGNIDVELISLTKNMFILFVIFTLVKLPLNLYMQFFVGMNTIYISEIYQILTLLINFITVLFVVYCNMGILSFVVLWLTGQLLLSTMAVFHVLIKYTDMRKESNTEGSVSSNDILKSGFSFFQVGIAASIVWSTDNLVISHFMSPEFVAPYSIAFKIFAYMFIFSGIINGVIGPMYGNAYANKDWESIRKYTFIIHKVLPILGALVWMFLIFFSKEIIILWAGNENAFGGYLLIFSLGLYGYILSFVNTYATLIYSLNFASKTLTIAWSEAFINLILSIILIQFLGIGGVALGTALSAFVIFLFLPRMIQRLTESEVIYNFKYIKVHFIFLVVPLVLLSVYVIDFNLISKILIFTFILVIYSLASWKLLSIDDRLFLLSVINKRG